MPRYRVLIHRQYVALWESLVDRVGLAFAQQFWDHVARSPGQRPEVNSTTVLKGKAGAPDEPGFSRTVHYEISGAGRINYQYCDDFARGALGDAHGVVRILTIRLGIH